MITGDNKATAQAIARQMGIARTPDSQAVDGRELQSMDDEALSARVQRIAVFARAAPEQKLRIVQQLRRRGEVVAVTTMVLFQNLYVLSSRSFTASVFRISPLGNRLLLAAVVAALGLQMLALYWPPLQLVLRTEPLALQDWLAIVPVAASVLLVVELEKAIRRARARPRPPA